MSERMTEERLAFLIDGPGDPFWSGYYGGEFIAELLAEARRAREAEERLARERDEARAVLAVCSREEKARRDQAHALIAERDALRAWVERARRALALVMSVLPDGSGYDAVVEATEEAARVLADRPVTAPEGQP